MAATKGMEATTLVRRLHRRPGEAIPPKTCRGRTLREIITLEASRCRGTIGWLRNTVGCTRPAARETGAIPRTPVLLRIDRRLHVVVSLLRWPGVPNSSRLVTPVVAFGRPAACISLRGAG